MGKEQRLRIGITPGVLSGSTVEAKCIMERNKPLEHVSLASSNEFILSLLLYRDQHAPSLAPRNPLARRTSILRSLPKEMALQLDHARVPDLALDFGEDGESLTQPGNGKEGSGREDVGGSRAFGSGYGRRRGVVELGGDDGLGRSNAKVVPADRGSARGLGWGRLARDGRIRGIGGGTAEEGGEAVLGSGFDRCGFVVLVRGGVCAERRLDGEDDPEVVPAGVGERPDVEPAGELVVDYRRRRDTRCSKTVEARERARFSWSYPKGQEGQLRRRRTDGQCRSPSVYSTPIQPIGSPLPN
jgi:hypothetical protein